MNKQAIYDVAQQWQQRCLIDDRALFTEEALWTNEHLYTLQTLLERSDVRTFDDAWRTQLQRADDAMYALLVEVLYIYYLFPQSSSVRYETKKRKLFDVAQAGGIARLTDEQLQPLQAGLAATGTFYNAAKYDEVRYIVQFALSLKYLTSEQREAVLASPWEGLKRLLVEARQTIQKHVQMEHILAHLLAPTYYACIASSAHKTQIIEAFKHVLKHREDDIDRQLYDLRQELAAQMEHVDFYAPPLYAMWQRKKSEPTLSLDGLVFGDASDMLRAQIETALKSGKHILFTGAPGTGKSKLATLVCEQLDQPYMRVTASANWSAYDTIGGYRPTKTGELQFHAGVFLQALKPDAKWLIIDEMNRANMDEAFGPLFSVLAGDDVVLPYEASNGQPVVMTRHEQHGEHVYVMHDHWRIIGTMNTSDKATLFQVSYALMRRFAFIPVPIPQTITPALMEQYLHVWGLTHHNVELLASLWQTIQDVRKIGPAIIEDVVRYVTLSEQDDMTSALILYVVPQLEGIAKYRIEEWLDALKPFRDHLQVQRLREACEDLFNWSDYE